MRFRASSRGVPGVANISDNITIHGRTKEEHDQRLYEVLRRLHQAGLTLNMEKCDIGVREMTFFRNRISSEGIDVDSQKVAAVKNAREPGTATEVRSFLGLVNFSAWFIPNLSTVAEPLRQLTRKNTVFKFGEAKKKSFEALKEAVTSVTTLGFYYLNMLKRRVSSWMPVQSDSVRSQCKNKKTDLVS